MSESCVTIGSMRGLPVARPSTENGFTLLEVMIAVGVLGIAMLALLSLHDSNLQSVARGNDMSTAATLAQGLMSKAELERFPMLGRSNGNFQKFFPGVYPNFSWAREVDGSAMFPDIRKVQITVFYGPKFRHAFSVVEFLHDPEPQQGLTATNDQTDGSAAQQQQQSPGPGQPGYVDPNNQPPPDD